jgi:hypothetical protein
VKTTNGTTWLPYRVVARRRSEGFKVRVGEGVERRAKKEASS